MNDELFNKKKSDIESHVFRRYQSEARFEPDITGMLASLIDAVLLLAEVIHDNRD